MVSKFVVLLALVASPSLAVPVADPVADASPDAYASDYSHYIPAQTYAALPSAQYHAQDDIGGYNYGFSSPDQQKTEVRDANGVVHGSYSYIDANGVIQTTNYISDALGFRVAATNLPVHNVEGAAVAPVVEEAVHEAPVAVHDASVAVHAAPVAVQAAPVAAPAVEAASAVTYDSHGMVANVPYYYLPYAANYGYQTFAAGYPIAPAVSAPAPVVQAAPAPVVAHAAAAPVVAQAAPVVAPVAHAAVPVVAPVVHAAAPLVTGSQYHAQDEAGQYTFGYNDANSVRQETKTADGAVSGAYQYVDSDGLVQTVQYVADAAGFRVAGTNLPVFAPAAPADTPEVAAAKAQHIQALATAEANAHLAEDAAHYAAAPVVAAPAPVVAAAAAPVVAAAAPVAAPLPVVAAGYYGIPDETAEPQVAALAEGYYGAVHPVVYNAVDTVDAAQVDALAEGYYGGAVASPVAVPAAPAPAPVVYSAPVPGIHAAPVAVASATPNVVAVASADPYAHIAPAAPVEATGYQYHSQDDIGQYSFGYSDGNSGKHEIKTADGVIRGSYSYVDSDGVIQTVNYIADALGFRVGATNLPVHHVEAAPVAVAEAAPVAEAVVEEPIPAPAYAVAQAPVMTPNVAYSYLPYATAYGYHNYPALYANAPAVAPVAAPAAEAVVQAAPVVAAYEGAAEAAPAVPIVPAETGVVSSQFHAQDEAGAYSYGYSSASQTKTEHKDANGVTHGSYSYVDANGLLQTVNYISDAMGFRVAATNLPVHVVGEEAEAAAEPGVEQAKLYGAAAPAPVLTPSVNYAYLPYAANYGYVAAPAA